MGDNKEKQAETEEAAAQSDAVAVSLPSDEATIASTESDDESPHGFEDPLAQQREQLSKRLGKLGCGG